ncbi:regulatory protein RecX [Salinicola acroporae]|uniref:Regulatory protein RecX n=1 Tax=Salinicola acroporae TaxID=1541440 RepID=A0ABT6IA45_9GAMM|nr:regulatory protein RecX [Salinicola acroporae]MDH4574155.1 recombinase RecX [Salinicola acroporae]
MAERNGAFCREETSRDEVSREVSPRDIAIRFLARREYARAELETRMSAKGLDSADIRQALDDLAREGLQSDARFAEVFVRSRIARGQGPVKIRVDMAQRGIDESLMSLAFESEAPDWNELASQALAKRFDSPGSTPRDRARRERFLAGRGFEFEQVHHAMRHAWPSGTP